MEVISAPPLEAVTHIKHFFFTRLGGVSAGEFASLNVGFASGDDAATVRENRRLALARLSTPGLTMVNCYQVHSNQAVRVEAPFGDTDPRADALVTDRPGLALSIFTADCVPVLFADRRRSVVGAAHVGWRGGAEGILDSTLSLMTELGADPDEIVGAIGPAIQQPSYEVGDDVRLTYEQIRPNYARYFASGEPAKWRFDLPAFVEDQLRERIGTVWRDPSDTYTDDVRFFSARRSSHRGHARYGRMLSAITLV